MSEYYAVIRSTDHLAHYGVKGMKWGVRKAVLLGNEKKLRRNFNKAARKLNKLQDKALRSGKYAAKSAAYGAAAAGVGTLAIGGTEGIKKVTDKAATLMRVRATMIDGKTSNPGKGKSGSGKSGKVKTRKALLWNKAGVYRDAADAVEKFGNATSEWGKSNTKLPWSYRAMYKDSKGIVHAHPRIKKQASINNNTLLRIGAGAAAAGLAAASAKNAYTATHGRKYLDKADQWRNAMDETFAGTKYQGQYVREPKQRKKRRKNYG